MKKILFLAGLFFLLCITSLFGQNPAMSYQAIVRDGNGQLVTNQSVTATIKVRIGSTDIFNQTYNVNTNTHGLLTLNFGDPIFMSTNWENASISCEVRQGSNIYMAENFQPVVAVPLSLYATSMNRDTLHSYLDTDGHILDIRHYMQQNRQYIIYNDIIIHQALEDTAAHIRREMAIMDSAIRSALVDTARDIRIALVDSSRDIRIALVDSSADIRSALVDSASDIRSALVDSARDIRIALVDTAADIRSALVDTAADIRSDMALMEAAIRSALVDTARDIRIALVDSSRDIRIALVDSSADIRSALVDSASNIRSALVDSARDIRIALIDTAADIRTFVGVREAAVRSALVDTAADIRTDMGIMDAAVRSALIDTAADIRSALIDTAADIRTFVGVREAAVRSALVDTAADIRTDMGIMDASVRSALIDTAADIRSALIDTAADIRTFVGVREAAVRSALVDTAADIRTDMGIMDASVRSALIDTAADIRSALVDTAAQIRANFPAGPTTYSVGDFAQGGIVFWVDETGEHGLVCTKIDQNTGVRWYAGTHGNTQAKGDGPYAGKANTLIIISSQVAIGDDNNTYAARICNELQITEGAKTYGDWYLPSKEELNLMYQNKDAINTTATANSGNVFATTYYWCSLEDNNLEAWTQAFDNGSQILHNKLNSNRVRAVRNF